MLLCCSVSYGLANNIITNPGPGGTNSTDSNNTVGFDFTVGSAPLLIAALGLWDQNLDGFSDSHKVGIWDNSGNLLGSVAISAGTVNPLSGEFRYVTLLTPITLLAGTTYVLGASYPSQVDRFVDNFEADQATFDSAVTSGNRRAIVGSGFAFPSFNFASGSYVGPNAQFTLVSNAVPDRGPGLFVSALVLAGLIFLHRRIGLFRLEVTERL